MKQSGLHKIMVLQQGESDCGVACLLSIIRYYNGNDTLENLRRLSGTNVSGTTLLGLYQAAGQCGFDAEGCEADIQSLIEHGKPCILHVTIDGQLQHYVVCFGTTPLSFGDGQGVRFIIGDPAKGIEYLSTDELKKIWTSYTCLTLEPNAGFKKAGDIKTAKRDWIKNLLKQDYPLLIIAGALGVAIAALGLAMAIFSQRLIDDILPKKNFTKLNLGIALVFALLLVKEGLSVLRQYFLLRQSKGFNMRIIDFFYHHLLRLPKPFFDNRKIGELTARLNDTSRIQRVISQLAGTVIIDTLVAMVSIIFVFTYSWQVGIACIVIMPIFFLLIYSHNKNISNSQRKVMSSYAAAEANYVSTLQGVDAIKNYNKQKLYTTANNSIYQNYQEEIFSLGKIQIKISFLANAFAVLFLILVLIFTSYRVVSGHLKTGELIAILGLCSSLLPSVANLALVSIPVNEAKIAFDRMFEFTGIAPEEETNNTSDKMNFEQMTVQNISFRFAGRRQLLKGLSLAIKRGEIIALMGENGSGKTSLSQLLQKNYLPETGNIVINGSVDLADISFDEWRNVVGAVPQDIHLFNGTVLENIAFEDAFNKTEEVVTFLQEYRFTSFIESLPQSYMTLTGEGGVHLSGGQKQMIALARALYHQPQLLILDEATSAMDRDSEWFVLNLLSHLKEKTAIIFITHRLHILKSFCDRIYILNNGQISVSGKHEELLQTENLYSRYWVDLVG